MNTELWKGNTSDILTNLADKKFQKKAWFTDTIYCVTLGEMCCVLFDDYSIALFLDDEYLNLNTARRIVETYILILWINFLKGV